MLKTLVLLIIFVETMIHFQDESFDGKFKRTALCDIINVFTLIFDQFNKSLISKNVCIYWMVVYVL